jgi:hypothetical protein
MYGTSWIIDENDNGVSEDLIEMRGTSIPDLEESRMFRETAICHFTDNPRHVNPHPYPFMGNIIADDMMQDDTYVITDDSYYYDEERTFTRLDVLWNNSIWSANENIAFLRIIMMLEIYA